MNLGNVLQTVICHELDDVSVAAVVLGLRHVDNMIVSATIGYSKCFMF